MNNPNFKQLRESIRNMKRGDKLSNFLITELSLVDWFALKFVQNNIVKVISNMQRHQPFYRILKDILTKLGYWKMKSRGDPEKGFKTGFGKKKE